MPKLEGGVAKIWAMPGFKLLFLFQCSLRPFYSCTDRSKWNLPTISDVLLKEMTDPELSEWGQQDLVSQETEEDYEGGFDILPEVIFST